VSIITNSSEEISQQTPLDRPAGDARQLLRGIPNATLAWGAAYITLLVLLYWEVGAVFAERWLGKSTYYHCLAVPPLLAWLVYIRWDRLRELRAQPSAAGIALLGSGLLLVGLGARLGVNLITGISFPFVAAGLVLLLWGSKALRILAMPLAVSFFLIAPPQHVLGMVTMPMQQVSAFMTQHASRVALGMPVMREGVTLELNDQKFVVAEQCSGMSSFLALSLTVIALIEMFGLPSGRKLIALLSIPVIVICANVVRLCIVLLTAQYLGAEFALGHVIHGGTDALVYIAALILVIMMLSALMPKEAAGDLDSEGAKSHP
jgi:exosortase